METNLDPLPQREALKKVVAELAETVTKNEPPEALAPLMSQRSRSNIMPVTEGDKMADRKRPPVVVLIIPLIVGLLGFYRMTQSRQFESYRTVDVSNSLGLAVASAPR